MPAAMDAFEVIIDLSFLLDIALNFNTCYVSSSIELVTDRKLIAKHYLLSWVAEPHTVPTAPGACAARCAPLIAAPCAPISTGSRLDLDCISAHRARLRWFVLDVAGSIPISTITLLSRSGDAADGQQDQQAVQAAKILKARNPPHHPIAC